MNRDSIYATMFANIESCVRTISEAMMRMECACTMCSAKRDRMYEGREREKEQKKLIVRVYQNIHDIRSSLHLAVM